MFDNFSIPLYYENMQTMFNYNEVVAYSRLFIDQ